MSHYKSRLKDLGPEPNIWITWARTQLMKWQKLGQNLTSQHIYIYIWMESWLQQSVLCFRSNSQQFWLQGCCLTNTLSYILPALPWQCTSGNLSWKMPVGYLVRAWLFARLTQDWLGGTQCLWNLRRSTGLAWDIWLNQRHWLALSPALMCSLRSLIFHSAND